MTTNAGIQPLALGINAAGPSLAVIFVVLRLYSRQFITRNLRWDDSLIVIPMVLAITMAVTMHLGIKASYTGYHYKDIPQLEQQPVLLREYNYVSQILYNPILALVKNAVLVFFLRLGGTFQSLRRFILSLLVLNSIMMVGIFIAVVFQCVPINKTFHPELPGTCINTPHFFIGSAGLTILTDILVIIIPTWLLWDLRMKPRKKIATIFLLSLGFLVTAISVYRLYYLITYYYGPPNPDPTYSVAGVASSIEVNVAIIAACGPSMKPLIVRFFPSVFERETTYDHAGGWPDSLSFGDRLRTYSASATAAKLGSSFGSDLELQQGSVARNLRGGKDGRPREAWDEDEDEDEYQDNDKMVATVPSMILMGQGPGSRDEVEKTRLQEESDQRVRRPGITRQMTVHITYSPTKSRHDA